MAWQIMCHAHRRVLDVTRGESCWLRHLLGHVQNVDWAVGSLVQWMGALQQAVLVAGRPLHAVVH